MYEVPSINNLHKVVVDESVVVENTEPLYVYDNIEKIEDTINKGKKMFDAGDIVDLPFLFLRDVVVFPW